MQKYVIYRRVSTNKQKKSGLGLEAQQRDIELYLNNYSDKPYEVIKSFTEAESGKADNEFLQAALLTRPTLVEAIEYCREHNAVLLVAKLDRLSRDVETVAHVIKHCDLRVACLPTADNFQLHLYASLAEQEREFIKLRVKDALHQKKLKGEPLGITTRPQDKNKLGESQTSKSNAFAETVAHHFIELIQRGASTTAIANTLNENGVLTRLNKKWSQPSVYNFIKRHQLRERAKMH